MVSSGSADHNPQLREPSGDGKLIDKWCYHVPTTIEGKIGTRVVNLEVRLKNTNIQSRNKPAEVFSTSFVVTCKELNISAHGTDIEAIRAAVWNKLDGRFESKIENLIMIRTNKEAFHKDIKKTRCFSLDFKVTKVRRLTMKDGSRFMIDDVYYRTSQYLQTWNDFIKRYNEDTVFLSDTSENNIAIESFMNQLSALHGKLSEFLTPCDAENNLLLASASYPSPET